VQAIACALASPLLTATVPTPATAQQAPAAAAVPVQSIDLQSAEGVAAVKGQWRFAPCRIVECEGKTPTGEPDRTFTVEPKAQAPDFDDSKWEAVDPTTLHKRRGKNHLSCGWYRIKVTLPEGVAGKKVTFTTRVDDYGEIWVDGELPYKVGQYGGNVVAGFNAPNLVELTDPQPGKTYSIAVFAINGPISVSPGNWLFLRDTKLEVWDRP
jgi:hypothetical protein